MDDTGCLPITHTLSIPMDELRFRFSRAGGPGGQHVNRSATQVELLFDVAHSPSLTEEQRARILVALATRHALWADLEALPPFAGPTRPLVRGRRLSQLSSGEAQRWLLAQSQLVHADLWLLDEPLQGLDAWGALTLRAELARYAHLSAPAARRYAVVVSHDPRLDDLATSVWRLGRGRVAPA